MQGVFFRESAKKEAERLSLLGFVRNERDGSVYAEVEGTAEEIEDFIRWCRKGPDSAKVQRVMVSGGELKNFLRFEVA